MQSEQPPQNQPNDQTRAPQNVPDYLHFEPVEVKPTKSKKKTVFILVAILVLLAGIGAAAYVIVMQQTSSQRRFDEALANLLQTSYVTREQQVTVDSTNVMSVTASTDLSNPAAPKSTLNYHFVPSPKTSQKATPAFEATGDVTVLADKNFYGRLNTFPLKLLPSGAKLNTWYEIDKPTATTKTNTATDFDYLKLRNTFNTVYGLVPIGNLGDDVRAQIASYIKTNLIYTISDTRSDMVNNKKTTVYTVKVNYQRVDRLHQELADKLGIAPSKLILTDSGRPLTMWVDNATNRLIKLKYVSGTSNFKNVATVEETYSYPASLSINTPTDATRLP